MSRASERALVVRYDDRDGRTSRAPDDLAVEEPLEIRLDGQPVATTMRSPGNDVELAVGFCHGEGLFGGAPLLGCRSLLSPSTTGRGIAAVDVDTGGRAPEPTERLSTALSSCGWCGSADAEDLVRGLEPLPPRPTIPLQVLALAPRGVRGSQELFDLTGAVHAAAAFTRDGEVLVVREDVGRHNAVDKVVGRLRLDGALPAHGLGLFVSGRASFEMVQKAWAAGFRAVVAVSAPTALAVHTARVAKMQLAGFVRDGTLTVYSPRPGDGPDHAAT
ncbi:MAG: formate dehydrogenase accessory sulfurtransferase FdhD [Actinomycetota bacterium]|nr:formate dehydrogenase accessory sulfurtransferase FdhD [Actinomycetota bacterium]